MGRKTKQSSSSSSSFWYSLTRSSSAPTTPRPEPATTAAATGEAPFGCMSMVHYLIFAPGAGCVGRPPTSSSSNGGAIVAPHDGHAHGRRRDDDGEGKKTSSSGFEAPRNSLDDLDADNPNDIQIGVQIEPVFDALASSRTASMRRCTGKKPTAGPSSEAETPRTPSLVARLMGIDGLPDDSPSPATGQQHKKPAGRRPSTTSAAAGKENTTTTTSTSCCCNSSPPPQQPKKMEEKKKRVIPESMTMNHHRRRRDREPLRTLSCNVNETRSLPDTPRASASARASWDGGARLSMQALRDNVLDRAATYMSMPSSPTSLSAAASGDRTKKKKNSKSRGMDEQRAAAAAKEEHAREILRQAKETVASRKQSGSSSKKNSASSSPAPEKKRLSSFFDNNNNSKENVMVSSSAAAAAMEGDDKLLVVVHEQTAKATKVTPKQSSEHQGQIPRVALAPRRQNQQQQQASPSHPPPPHRAKPSRPPPPPPPLDPPTRARKPDGCERFATRAKNKPGPCPASTAPTPSSASSPSPTTADCRSSPAATTAARAHATASSSTSTPLVVLEENEEDRPEYRYLRSVLERGGFMRSSPPPRRWRGHCGGGGYYSSSAAAAWPVDPIVFHLLELELPVDDEAESRPSRLGALRHRWNRKLLFHLAQELLADHLDASPSSAAVSSRTPPPSTGLPLLGTVWRSVRSFPAADCRVVGDIDALVAADLLQQQRRRPGDVAEEARVVAADVADHVLDALLAESAAVSLSSS